MSLITDILKMDAVYWGISTSNQQYDDDGQPIINYQNPVDVRCFWIDKQEEFLDRDGNKRISRAMVLVDRDMDLLGVLCQGTIASLLFVENPFENNGAFEIRKFDKIPDIDVREYLRKVWL